MADCIIVRSRLHAISACEILKKRLSPNIYILVEVYSRRSEQESTIDMMPYRELRRQSFASFALFGDRPVHEWIVPLVVAFGFAWITKGTIMLAIIDSYPIALAARLWPRLRIHTFDDGIANFISDNGDFRLYYQNNILEVIGLKRLFLNVLFPFGSTSWFRRRIHTHYTLDQSMPNIVASNNLKDFSICWEEWLEPNDVDWASRVSPIVLMLGTPFSDFADKPLRQRLLQKRDYFLTLSDFYFPHPREHDLDRPRQELTKSLYSPKSAAESFIVFWIKKRCLKRVYHFGSAVAANMIGASELEFIDLLSLSKGESPSLL